MGQGLRPADEPGVDEGRLARELDGVEPAEELPEDGADLHPREVGAEAEVRPKPNARWLEALARVTSSRNGSAKTSSSRFADAYDSSAMSPGWNVDVAQR